MHMDGGVHTPNLEALSDPLASRGNLRSGCG